MALVPFTGTVSASTLRANFDDATTTLAGAFTAGVKDHVVSHIALAFSGTGTAVADFLDFRPPDDMEVRVLRIVATDGTAGRTVTATLTQTDGDTSYLLDQTFSVSATTVIGTVNANLDCRTVTQSRRVVLARGVRFRLTLATSAGPVTSLQAALVLRTVRRLR